MAQNKNQTFAYPELVEEMTRKMAVKNYLGRQLEKKLQEPPSPARTKDIQNMVRELYVAWNAAIKATLLHVRSNETLSTKVK